MDAVRKIDGKIKERDVKLFALSTCGWCKKTKSFLKDLDIEYLCIDFDLLSEEEKKEMKEEVKTFNPALSFPTLVIDEGDEVIVGFKKDRIKEVLCHED